MKKTASVKQRKIQNGILVLVLAIFSALTIVNAVTYTPYWLDTDQHFRVPFNITGATTDLDSVTTTLNINAAFMGPNFDFSNSNDIDSIRIYYYNTSNNNYTPAPHYITNWNAGTSTGTLQFKAPFLNSGTTTPYMIYFGDITKSNIENLCDTYIYCDDFNDASIDSRLSTLDADGVAGTAFSESGGVLSITAGGADTWTGSDEFGSVYLRNISGDVDVQVAIISQTNPNTWCKSGIMIRNDMSAPGSSTGYSFNVRTPGNGYSFQRDSDNNGYLDANNQGGAPTVFPSYLRMVKTGTTFSGYYSKTTPTAWNLITSSTITSANNIQDIGLSLTSHAGATTATSTYDNLTIRRYTTDTFTFNPASDETLVNYITLNITSPSIITTHNIPQNKTITINALITCNSYDGSSCNTISTYVQRLNGASFQNIATTPTTPMWTTNSNPQTCVLTAGNSCPISFNVNLTGIKNSIHKLRLLSSSSITNIDTVTSQNVTAKIIIGNSVNFNQSTLDFGSFLKNSGDKSQTIKVISDNGDNTNINLECKSGDCTRITSNWINGINLNEANSQDFDFTCSDQNAGTYTAIYNLTSNEYDGESLIEISCTVLPTFGPMVVTLNTPTPHSTITVGQNQTFKINASMTCSGYCGNVSAFAIYSSSTNGLTNYWRKINISTTQNAPIGYQILLKLNQSELGTNFDWSNNCNDVRFKNSGTDLDYWIENCNTTSKNIAVWVKTNAPITTANDYEIELHYGNSTAISQSNAANTFRNNEIHLITGTWANSAPVNSQYLDDHTVANNLREILGITPFTTHGSGYVTQINHPSNPYGADDAYFMRYRFLFIPTLTQNYNFGTASDDGSEMGIWQYDGYGSGIRTPTSVTAGAFDIVANYYGAHGTGTCGVVGTQSARTLQSGQGYWIDYVMGEWAGGQDAQGCINTGGGYNTISTANFPGQIYSRNYVTPEPYVSIIGDEESNIISPIYADLPLFTTNTQPQTCTPTEDGTCNFEWDVNASGPINSSFNISVLFKSSYSTIEDNETQFATINITDNIMPEITLISPVNNLKFLNNGLVNFIWQVNDDSTTLNCSLYINNIHQATQNCQNTGNNSINISILNSGTYNWSIIANDTNNNSAQSQTYNFTLIKNYNMEIEKQIKYENTNQYKIETTLKNKAQTTWFGTIIDFVSNLFTSGSFSPLSLFTNTTSQGETIGWNQSLVNASSSNVSYSISGMDDYRHSENYVVGLD